MEVEMYEIYYYEKVDSDFTFPKLIYLSDIDIDSLIDLSNSDVIYEKIRQWFKTYTGLTVSSIDLQQGWTSTGELDLPIYFVRTRDTDGKILRYRLEKTPTKKPV
jgi:hypothetical protein